jgi:hypothetical protein
MIEHFRSPSRWLGKRLRQALPIALALVVGSAWPAMAQLGATGQLAIRSDGFVFWIQDGQRHVVYPASLSDEQINALPEGIPLNAALQPGTAPGAPSASVQAMPDGTSRTNRLVPGQTCNCFIIRGTGQRSDLQIRLTEVDRAAWPSLKLASPTNQPPKDGFDYLMLKLNIKYTGGANDLPLSVDRFDFVLLDSNDTMYVPAFVVEPEALTSNTVYPGSELNARIAYQVPRGDPDVVMVWRHFDENRVWFGIP